MKRLTIILAALGALLLVSASPAMASELTEKETFGTAAEPEFTKPTGMTVDPASGDLLVIDLTEQTLSRFEPNGEPDPFTALDSNVIDGAGGADKVTSGPQEILSNGTGVSEAEVAVAPPSAGATAGDIYVTDAENGRIVIFKPSGEYLGQKAIGYSCGVAVDSAGTVFVGNYEPVAAVYKFNPTSPGNLSEVARFETVETPCLVAAGTGPSAGYVFAAPWEAGVEKLDASTGAVKYVVEPNRALGLSVDSGSGYLYVADASVEGTPINAFDVSGASAITVTSTPVTFGVGVAVNGTSHDVYSSSTGSEVVKVYSQPAAVGPKLILAIEEGSGTVVSNPAGLECIGASPKACSTEAIAANTKVVLTASPASGYLFKSWKGCDTGGVNGRQCTVTLSAAKSVGAKFVKAFSLEGKKSNPNGILNTAPGGVNCGYGCLSSSALYKEGALTLKAKPAKNFHFVEFKNGTGSAASCNGVTTETCSIASFNSDSVIEEAYAEDAKNTLTLSKIGGGQGFIKTKPTNINCGYTCTKAKAEFFSSEEIAVTVTLNKGTTQVTWIQSLGFGGTCTGHVLTCTVPMSGSQALEAKFE